MELRRRIAAVAGLGLLCSLLLPVTAAAAAPQADNAWVSLDAYAGEVGASVRLDNLTGDVWVVWDGSAWLVYPPDVSATPGVSPQTVRRAGGVVQMRLRLLERLMPQPTTTSAVTQAGSAAEGGAAPTAASSTASSASPAGNAATATTSPPTQGTPSTSATGAESTTATTAPSTGSDAAGELSAPGSLAPTSVAPTSVPTPSPSTAAPGSTVPSSMVPGPTVSTAATATSVTAPSSSNAAPVAPAARTGGGLFARLAAGLRSVLGAPYAWGGESPAGFDCSGLVQWAFHLLGIALPRTSWAQYAATKPAPSLVPGDLVFFQTYAPGASHVGIYLGAGRFVTAGTSGVTVARLSEPYWAARYLGARAVISS